MLAFLDAPGFGEILLILFVALLAFGGSLPEIAKKAGRRVAELKKGVSDFREEMQKETDAPVQPPPAPPASRPPEEKLPQG